MIALGCDHAGFPLKAEIVKLLEDMKLEYHDFGTFGLERVDYPLFAQRAAEAVASGACDRGILLCGTGVGIGITANKVPGIRCVTCSDCLSAEMSRRHNDTNMLAMGARVIGGDLAVKIAREWLTAPFEGGRHAKRVEMIMRVGRGERLE